MTPLEIAICLTVLGVVRVFAVWFNYWMYKEGFNRLLFGKESKKKPIKTAQGDII